MNTQVWVLGDTSDGTLFQTTVSDGSGVTNGISITDYAYDIAEIPDGINKVFTLRHNYLDGSTHVYLQGIRQTPGVDYDYIETGNKQIMFSEAPLATTETRKTLIVVDYLTTDDIDSGIFEDAFEDAFE